MAGAHETRLGEEGNSGGGERGVDPEDHVHGDPRSLEEVDHADPQLEIRSKPLRNPLRGPTAKRPDLIAYQVAGDTKICTGPSGNVEPAPHFFGSISVRTRRSRRFQRRCRTDLQFSRTPSSPRQAIHIRTVPADRPGVALSQCRADSVEQFFAGRWFGNVVIAAGLQASLSVAGHRVGC